MKSEFIGRISIVFPSLKKIWLLAFHTPFPHYFFSVLDVRVTDTC